MISKRISDLPCNKEEFGKVKSVYQTSPKGQWTFPSISSNNSNIQNAQRNRNRKVIWFNPPYCQNVNTNIGKLLINLVKKHLLKNNKYHNIFNLSTLKLSYCSGAQPRIFRSRGDFLEKRHFDKRFMYDRTKNRSSVFFLQDTLKIAFSMKFNPQMHVNSTHFFKIRALFLKQQGTYCTKNFENIIK